MNCKTSLLLAIALIGATALIQSESAFAQSSCKNGTTVDTITNGEFNLTSPNSTGTEFGRDLAALISGNNSWWDYFNAIPGWYSARDIAQIELWSPTFVGDTQNAPGTGDAVNPIDGSLTLEVKSSGPGSVFQDFCSSGQGNVLSFQLYARTGLPHNSVLDILVDGELIGHIDSTTTSFVAYSFYIPTNIATPGMHTLELRAPVVEGDPLPSYGDDIRHVQLTSGHL
jgi:hypothetical protein